MLRQKLLTWKNILQCPIQMSRRYKVDMFTISRSFMILLRQEMRRLVYEIKICYKLSVWMNTESAYNISLLLKITCIPIIDNWRTNILKCSFHIYEKYQSFYPYSDFILYSFFLNILYDKLLLKCIKAKHA